MTFRDISGLSMARVSPVGTSYHARKSSVIVALPSHGMPIGFQSCVSVFYLLILFQIRRLHLWSMDAPWLRHIPESTGRNPRGQLSCFNNTVVSTIIYFTNSPFEQLHVSTQQLLHFFNIPSHPELEIRLENNTFPLAVTIGGYRR